MHMLGWTLRKAKASLQQPGSKEVLLITLLGMVEGEVLTYLDAHGTTALHHLAQTLEWPMPLIIMAAGALIRRGLVRGIQSRQGTVLEPQSEAAPVTTG